MNKHDSEDCGIRGCENDVNSLWRELQKLGSLPLQDKNEGRGYGQTKYSLFKNVLFRILEKKTDVEVTSVSEVAITPVNIPIVIEEKVQDKNTAAAVMVNSAENFATAINWNLKETNIETEKTENIKTLKSFLKSDNKTKIPISIKIPIRHEKPVPSSPEPTGCQHQCQPGEGDGSLHSVSTQTDKNVCSIM